MKPERILLTLVESHHGNPLRPALETVLFKTMNGERINDIDVAALKAAFTLHPILDTLDQQELLEWLA